MTIFQTERVAWAWLDKLRGRPQPMAPRVAPVGLSPKERHVFLQTVYAELKDQLIASIRSEIPQLRHAQGVIAKKYGLDPLFLDWFIINNKHWPPMDTRHLRGLYAVNSIFIWYGAVPSQWNHMVLPEISQGDDRDAATIEFADWFLKNTLVHVSKRFMSSVWKKSRELIDFFGPPQEGALKASGLLLEEFVKRLVADRFQLQPAVQKVVDLIH